MQCAGMEANLTVLRTHLALSQVVILVYRDVKCDKYVSRKQKKISFFIFN